MFEDNRKGILRTGKRKRGEIDCYGRVKHKKTAEIRRFQRLKVGSGDRI
jgi:hypothetical protein